MVDPVLYVLMPVSSFVGGVAGSLIGARRVAREEIEKCRSTRKENNMIKMFVLLAILFPLLALAQTGGPLDPILPILGDKVASRVIAVWPIVFYGAHAIKKVWNGRHTIVGRLVFPVLDFLTGDTVKVGP